MLENGYHDLAPDQLAASVTYLRHDLSRLPAPPDRLALQPVDPSDIEGYRALFLAIGAPWLWFGRLKLDDEALVALLAHPDYEARMLIDGHGPIGLIELDFRAGQEPELAYLGLKPGHAGRGFGRALIAHALNRAQNRGASHLMVHTCSFDAPGALDFYRKAGFVPYRRAIEVFIDPRLDGTLPREAADRVPLIA